MQPQQRKHPRPWNSAWRTDTARSLPHQGPDPRVSSGIRARPALGRGFAEAGADLLLIDRSATRLTMVTGDIAARLPGARVDSQVIDITSDADLDQIANERVDVLVNNAYAGSGSYGKDILDVGPELWDAAMRTNVLAPYALAQRFCPGMRERGTGNIINVVSGSGLLPTKGLLPYGASKAALWMMTRYLANELAPVIRVNALCPGIVVADGAAPDPSADSVLPLIPLGRTGRPDEMVGAAVYLASDASSYTTGSLLVCNGGRPW
jgi:NAD(P)-dependent dehydrogenase (short-subunit alcohol dehydrogenase family)